MKLLPIFFAYFLALLPAASPQPAAPGGAPFGFIRVNKNPLAFVDDNCRDFLPIGWNGWISLNKEAADAVANRQLSSNPVTQQFKYASDAGFNTLRIFGYGAEGFGSNFLLQTAPGVYNEYVFKALDYILEIASRNNMKVIFTLVNNWQKEDGKVQFVKWAGLSEEQEDQFWTNPTAKQLVKNHYSAIMNRKNSMNGFLYKEDPTIFSWNLFNEHRCPQNQNEGDGCPGIVTEWVNEMAAYVKSIDPNHMVTVGEEGFFVVGDAYQDADPFGRPDNVAGQGRYWAGKVGQDFRAQHSSPNIDYAAIHMWPDNWNTTDLSFPPLWIEKHIQAANEIGKPLLIEEFGKALAPGGNAAIQRDPYFKIVQDAVQTSIANQGPLRGDLFWKWNPTGADGLGSGDRDITNSDSTFTMIKKHVADLAEEQGKVVVGCVRKGIRGPAASRASPQPAPIQAFGLIGALG